jgi:hypothetical protein
MYRERRVDAESLKCAAKKTLVVKHPASAIGDLQPSRLQHGDRQVSSEPAYRKNVAIGAGLALNRREILGSHSVSLVGGDEGGRMGTADSLCVALATISTNVAGTPLWVLAGGVIVLISALLSLASSRRRAGKRSHPCREADHRLSSKSSDELGYFPKPVGLVHIRPLNRTENLDVNRIAALRSFVEERGLRFVDQTVVDTPDDVFGIGQTLGPRRVVLFVWDKVNAADPMTLDIATAAAYSHDLISVTFDGARPGFGFASPKRMGIQFFDLSEWSTGTALPEDLGKSIVREAEKAEVFVSYARADQDLARQFCEGLASAGWAVWWDASLTPGTAYAEVIKAKILEVSAVVVLWSAASIKSHWVLDEAALGRDRQVLIPVAVQAVGPPMGFGQIHTLRLASSDPKAIQLTCEDVSAAVAQLIARRAA